MLGPGAGDTFTSDTLGVLGNGFELGTAFLGALGFGTDMMEISGLGLFPSAPGAQGDSVLLVGTLTFTALGAGASSLDLLPHPIVGVLADVKGLDPTTLRSASPASARSRSRSQGCPCPSRRRSGC